jgi:hypothetical protein
LTIDESLPGSGRPFYLLVIAPNRESLDRLYSYVLNTAGAPVTFGPGEAAIAVNKIVSPVPGEPIVWIPHVNPQQSSDANQDDPLSFRVTALQTVPVEGLRRLQYRIRKATYAQNHFGNAETVTLPVTAEGTTAKEELEFRVTIRLPRPMPGTWDVYQILWKPGEGNLRVPSWVNDWTTEDDSTPKSGNKTFRLSLLVEAMMRAITEDAAFCEQYICLGRSN